MSNDDAAGALPAPLSLTLEEAGKIAAGTLYVSAVQSWWWKGQPASHYLTVGSDVTQPVAVAAVQSLAP